VADSSIRVEELTEARARDLDRLFSSDDDTDHCWCMWFLIPVKTFHEQGHDGNKAGFLSRMEADPHPMGLIAYDGDDPVGWCAAGPRDRFARVLRVPTLRNRDKAEDSTAWLVPCFFVATKARGKGVSRVLLEGAVELARSRGAPSIEGFPLAGSARRSSGSDLMTGVEPLFAACGFEPVDRPSDNRVVMRRSLA
jgi:GNAT superfamily N-acetyltransferase